MRSGYILTIAGLLAANGVAQQGSVAGPTSGMVFDQRVGTLRPIVGVPGAATFGDGVTLGYPVSWMVVSPRLDSAVAVAGDGSLHFLKLANGVTETPVSGLVGQTRQAVFSPSGTAAALLSGREAQIITGLPTAPVLSSTVRLAASPAAGTPRKTAGTATRIGPASVSLSDDGAVLLVTDGGSVRMLGANSRTVGSGVLAAFAPGAHDVAVADGAGVTLIRGVDSGAQSTVLAADGVADPVGLAFSADGATVYAAVATGVVALPAAGGAASQVACACQPATVAPMGKLFRLNEPGQGPLWLLDPNGQAPRTVFVPASQ